MQLPILRNRCWFIGVIALDGHDVRRRRYAAIVLVILPGLEREIGQAQGRHVRQYVLNQTEHLHANLHTAHNHIVKSRTTS